MCVVCVDACGTACMGGSSRDRHVGCTRILNSSNLCACVPARVAAPCVLQIYRTPFMLRHCTSLLIHLGAVVLGPYFCHIAVCDEGWVAAHNWCPAPYVMAVIYSIICMLLLNVQVCGF